MKFNKKAQESAGSWSTTAKILLLAAAVIVLIMAFGYFLNHVIPLFH